MVNVTIKTRTIENCKILTDLLPNFDLSNIVAEILDLNNGILSKSYHNFFELIDDFKIHSAAFPCFSTVIEIASNFNRSSGILLFNVDSNF